MVIPCAPPTVHPRMREPEGLLSGSRILSVKWCIAMIDPASHRQLRTEISERISDDREILDSLRGEIRPLKGQVRRIQARSTTAISLVATDGGNNTIQFDLFLVQLVRVVDSSNNEYCLQAITPTTNVGRLGSDQFYNDGTPKTPLGDLMDDLGVADLTELSHMIRRTEGDRPTSPSWVQVYREVVEWATLYSILKRKQFGTDTLIVFDGLLRSKVFAGDLFKRYLELVDEMITRHYQEARRRIYLVGLAKHSKVLARYPISDGS